MEEDIQNHPPTVMFRGTHCIIFQVSNFRDFVIIYEDVLRRSIKWCCYCICTWLISDHMSLFIQADFCQVSHSDPNQISANCLTAIQIRFLWSVSQRSKGWTINGKIKAHCVNLKSNPRQTNVNYTLACNPLCFQTQLILLGRNWEEEKCVKFLKCNRIYFWYVTGYISDM